MSVVGRYLFATAKGIADLPDDWFLRIHDNGSSIEIQLMDARRAIGHIKTVRYPECGHAHVVTNVAAPSGWGPFLYDLAMDIAGEDGIMPDRGQVSPAAAVVWAYYYRNRRDVTKHYVPEEGSGVDCPFHDERAESILDFRYVADTGLLRKLHALGRIRD